ncbi:substrate-binding domain-containing protein [Litorilituus lipolyticus]|uniref:Cell envelope biogenesis protein OmpA n=1 Tax=Litorilituus lipolyticus TaxID=2491017 RepID=A0A502KYQ3_9GAMM|nr:phosphate ABC transporter substrate-binding/OmpA family protein [Litorilituus lipolyticus]TPH15091.1 cell envelope biogenesis protein OmpA [Litorilituus lipolyticus]
MESTFSGIWNTENNALSSVLNTLTQLANEHFDIEISPHKMLEESHYRELVLSELAKLDHQEINELISWLQTPIKKNPKTKARPFRFIAVTLALIAMIGCGYWYSSSMILNEPTLKAPIVTIEKQSPKVEQTKQASKIDELPPILEPIPSIAFRLHGSNTIGEKLAPALLEAFLTQQGAQQLSWRKGANSVERELHFLHEGNNKFIELHAHGSSTAFADLKLAKAEIGMASRRIKNTELLELSASLGSLDQVGNEHIIGLDGLAVIVNQNNGLKKLSTKTLAKVFSGEINNWSQLGGENKAITIYSRDEHSGTWDTFKNLVLKKYSKKLSDKAIRLESSTELSAKVSQNENAIGFIGLNYVLHNKALAIAASKNTTAIFPTRFTIGTEDYALARRLYFYTPTSASPLVKSFAQFAISTQGQNIVAETGLISQNIKLEETYLQSDAPSKYNHYVKNGKRLSLNFRFDYATKDLDNKGKRDLHRLVSFMEQHNGRRIALLGFSDSVGAQLKNQNLSLQRAKSVELELTSRGIPVMSVEGFGEALPIANNNTEAGRKRNRRVEVWLL